MKKSRTGTYKYEYLVCTEADLGAAEIKGYGSDCDDDPISSLRYIE